VASEIEARIGFNEATFREINEGVRATPPDARLSFRCECGRLGCNQLVALSRPQYEAVRTNPRRFFVIPGHELTEFERVVERHDDYTVVEKHKHGAEIAERTDPRRPLDE
jgi:hypothetical protein